MSLGYSGMLYWLYSPPTPFTFPHLLHYSGKQAPGLPVSKVITHGVIRIGLIHGHQIIPADDPSALEVAARQMDVDILISGHTHRHGASERGGRFYVNPGSATGAYSSVSRYVLVMVAFLPCCFPNVLTLSPCPPSL